MAFSYSDRPLAERQQEMKARNVNRRTVKCHSCGQKTATRFYGPTRDVLEDCESCGYQREVRLNARDGRARAKKYVSSASERAIINRDGQRPSESE